MDINIKLMFFSPFSINHHHYRHPSPTAGGEHRSVLCWGEGQVAGDNIERKVFVNLLGRTPAAATQSLFLFNKTVKHSYRATQDQ